MMMKLLFIFCGLVFNSFFAMADELNQEDLLFAGASKEKITPTIETFSDINENGKYDLKEPFTDLNNNGSWDPVWLGGNQNGRFALGAHDDLWAKSLIVESSQTSLILISLDLIGFLFDEVDSIQTAISEKWGIPAEQIFIASTHNHSGPDTIGLWGESGSGKNSEYLSFVKAQVLKSVKTAMQNKKKAKIVWGKTEYSNPIHDARPPEVINDLLLSFRLEDEQGATIATIVNYSMHAEVLNEKNRLITADYPGTLTEKLEKHFGGVALFFAGDIGGMQTPKIFFHTFFISKKIGENLAKEVILSLKQGKSVPIETLHVKQETLMIPIENPKFLEAMEKGIFGSTKNLLKESDGQLFIPAEIGFIQIGPAQFVTVPGELFPELGHVLRNEMKLEYKFLFGLCNNEIGYIVPEEDWNPNGYEETMSLGPKTSALILSTLLQLIKN
ncbi:MAG: hypothetical protein A3G85_08620 [Elusimicrobia bacterium RIFCSPLOWO2_12_FULL_39_28]|nr:MAG: hypothetical protein A3G85_08620 [Elusimicrobia bacterium RIFCSPLOWO2_12_FULL_39_28]